MDRPEIIKTELLMLGAYQKEDYAQIKYQGQEVGFINKDGIYLKMYSPKIPEGCYQKITTKTNATFSELCTFFNKHWEAIYDRYTTIFRGR